MSKNNSDNNVSSSAESGMDTDWGHVRGTMLLLQAAVTHIQLSMTEGDESINELVGSFSQLIDKTTKIKGIIEQFPESPQKDEMAAEFIDLDSDIHNNIVAFQFYDKLNQRIEHIRNGLDMLSELLGSESRAINQEEWLALQGQIKKDFHVDDDKILFDAIINGASREEALRLYRENKDANKADDIDFF